MKPNLYISFLRIIFFLNIITKIDAQNSVPLIVTEDVFVDGKPMSIDAKLSLNTTFEIKSDSGIAVILHPDQTFSEVHKKGKYTIRDLQQEAKNQEFTEEKKALLKVLFGQLRDTTLHKYQYLKKTGSISHMPPLIKMLLPRSSEVFGDSILIRWSPNALEHPEMNPKNLSYTVYVTTMEDSILFEKKTLHPYVKLEIATLFRQAEAEQLIIKVIPFKNGKAMVSIFDITGNMLQQVDKNTKEEYQMELDKLELQEDKIIDKLLKVKWFIQQEFDIDAFSELEQTYQLAPSCPNLRRFRIRFYMMNYRFEYDEVKEILEPE